MILVKDSVKLGGYITGIGSCLEKGGDEVDQGLTSEVIMGGATPGTAPAPEKNSGV